MGDDPRPEWAVRLQAEREKRDWSKFELARRLHAAVGIPAPEVRKLRSLVRQIYGWESGEHFPRDWANAYAAAYGVTAEELFGSLALGAESAPSMVARPTGTLTTDRARIAEVIAAMERRQALMLMGLGVAAPWPVAENLRAALACTAGATDGVADWRETVSDYAATMSATPPQQLLPDLLTDLNEVNALLEAGHPERKQMLEVAAALATFTSMATYDSGHPGRAFRWWRTAQHLADRSGYAPIRAYVRARRGADLLYGHQQTAQALQLADEALGIAQHTPSVGLAEAHALRAAALADSGNPEAQRAADEMARIAERLTIGQETYAPSWPAVRRVQGTRTAMHVKLGNGAAAVRAGQANPHPSSQLWVAAGMVLDGKVDDGIGHAVHTLKNLSPADDRLSVRNKGRDVLAVVPDRARASASARQLRELTAGGP